MPVDGPSYLVGRTDEIVLTICFGQVLTIDACGLGLKPHSVLMPHSILELLFYLITCPLSHNATPALSKL
jgi:hypothetical protein